MTDLDEINGVVGIFAQSKQAGCLELLLKKINGVGVNFFSKFSKRVTLLLTIAFMKVLKRSGWSTN